MMALVKGKNDLISCCIKSWDGMSCSAAIVEMY